MLVVSPFFSSDCFLRSYRVDAIDAAIKVAPLCVGVILVDSDGIGRRYGLHQENGRRLGPTECNDHIVHPAFVAALLPIWISRRSYVLAHII